MSNILKQICDDKRIEVDSLKRKKSLKDLINEIEPASGRPFRSALSTRDRINIIAELKKSSPSRGILLEDFDVPKIAKQYADGGAAALSVLTEKKYFSGCYDYMLTAKKAANLPILCKDFVVDEYQLYYAQSMGADAILLIAAIHDQKELSSLISVADEMKLDTLVEVHNEEEMDKAIEAGATIIGVNNRDLTSFDVDLTVSERLSKLIPDNVIKVAESGLFVSGDIARLKDHGYNCFLIGEALIKSDDPTKSLKELRSV